MNKAKLSELFEQVRKPCQKYGDRSRCGTCFLDDRSNPQLAENKRKFVLDNHCRKLVLVQVIDGCQHPASTGPKRCDGITIADDLKTVWLVELKGSSFADACGQLYQSYELMKHHDFIKQADKIQFVAVLSSGKAVTKSVGNSSSCKKLDKLVAELNKQKPGTALIQKEGQVLVPICAGG